MILIRNTAWCLSNFFRGKPIPNLEFVKVALPTLYDMLVNVTDEEALSDILWAFSYLT